MRTKYHGQWSFLIRMKPTWERKARSIIRETCMTQSTLYIELSIKVLQTAPLSLRAQDGRASLQKRTQMIDWSKYFRFDLSLGIVKPPSNYRKRRRDCSMFKWTRLTCMLLDILSSVLVKLFICPHRVLLLSLFVRVHPRVKSMWIVLRYLFLKSLAKSTSASSCHHSPLTNLFWPNVTGVFFRHVFDTWSIRVYFTMPGRTGVPY